METNVELIPAFVWDCPECGEENFERSIVVDPQSDLAKELEEELRLEGVESTLGDGRWMQAPEIVRCKACYREFPTKHLDEDEPS